MSQDPPPPPPAFHPPYDHAAARLVIKTVLENGVKSCVQGYSKSLQLYSKEFTIKVANSLNSPVHLCMENQ